MVDIHFLHCALPCILCGPDSENEDCHLSLGYYIMFLSGYSQWQRTGLHTWRSTLLSIGVSLSVVPFPMVIP